MSNVGLFKCKTCFKTYKTKNRLIRHHNTKHVVTEISNIKPTQCSTSATIDEVKTVVNTLSKDNVTELLQEMQELLLVNECLTPELYDVMKNTKFS